MPRPCGEPRLVGEMLVQGAPAGSATAPGSSAGRARVDLEPLGVTPAGPLAALRLRAVR